MPSRNKMYGLDRMKHKVSDLIARRVKQESDVAFGVTGGCVVNLVDSLHKEGVRIIPMHHEQSAAIAADAYARFKDLGVCFGTSGPGTTNLITGTCCSYYDSVPVLTLGGQVPRKFLDGKDRQMGFQETDGVRLFEPITKYAKRMESLIDLEHAIAEAKTPRRGPVFLEIPDDYQREQASPVPSGRLLDSKRFFPEVITELVEHAEKPLVIVGNGARDAQLDLEVPFLYTWGTKDMFYNTPYCKGDFGITGSPNGNQMTKEADLILMLGTRMDTHQVPNWEEFAPQAIKIAAGLEFPHKVNLYCDTPLDFRINLKGNDWGQREDHSEFSHAYRAIDAICDASDEGDIIIPDMGQTGCITLQRWKPKNGQRLFNGMNHSPMGYSLPAAIGATVATNRPVKVIVGEGSLMMNMHDLQTIGEMDLPVKIYMINNGGYGMIRQTQDDWKQYLDQGVACNLKAPRGEQLRDMFGVDITEIELNDTRIRPKWKYGTKL